jgi:hypothetical protein
MIINIGGVDRTSSILLSSLKISNKINNRVDSCDFRIKKQSDKTYKPQLNDEVIITNDSVIIFGGAIVRIDESANAGNQLVLKVQCSDYSQYLKRELVTNRYENTTLIAIVNALVTDFTDDGFTTTNVVLSKTIKSFSFNGLTVTECLDKLAKSLNAYWYVDYQKDIHFFARNKEEAPFNITDTSKNYFYESLKITEDITQLRNKVTVKGGTNPSSTPRTETTVCQDADQDVYPLGYKFAGKPIVEVNNVVQTVGVEFLDDNASFDVMWSYQQKYIRFTAGNFPSVGNVLEVIGNIEIPVVVRISDDESVAEYGIFEYQVSDPTISTNDEAIARALAELDSFASELHEGTFSTANHGLRAGQLLNINSAIREKDINIIIQAVTAKPIDAFGERVVYDVDFATVKTLGIIEFLQNSLINETITEDAQETLLTFVEQTPENIAVVDTGVQSVEQSTAPYKWAANDAEDNLDTFVWNYGTYS